MKKENFYRRDPLAALNGMIGLTLEERAVYNTVIDLLYSTWRPIEDDRKFIANWCGCAVQRLNPIMDRLIAKERLIRFQDGARWFITDGKFEDERSAVKGPKPTPKKASGQAEVEEKSAGVSQNHPLLDTENAEKQGVTALDKTREEKSIPPTPLPGGESDLFGAPEKPSRRKPKRPIPDDFPTSEQIGEAQGQSRQAGADVDMAYQARRFRNWALGSDVRYADWNRTWANWVDRAIKEAPRLAVAVVSAAPRPDSVADQWRRRVEFHLKRDGPWNTTDWGARPGKPGCLAPPEILAEFGIGADVLPFANEGRAA